MPCLPRVVAQHAGRLGGRVRGGLAAAGASAAHALGYAPRAARRRNPGGGAGPGRRTHAPRLPVGVSQRAAGIRRRSGIRFPDEPRRQTCAAVSRRLLGCTDGRRLRRLQGVIRLGGVYRVGLSFTSGDELAVVEVKTFDSPLSSSQQSVFGHINAGGVGNATGKNAFVDINGVRTSIANKPVTSFDEVRYGAFDFVRGVDGARGGALAGGIYNGGAAAGGYLPPRLAELGPPS